MSKNYPPSNNRPGGYPPPVNEALNKFCSLIQTRRFIDNDILSLNEDLGRTLASKREDTITQINKFYNLVKVAEATDVAQIQVKLHVLKAQITYATARETISLDFKKFFDVSLEKILKNTNQNERKEWLKDFATFFESVYAYFYFYTKTSRGGN